MSEWVEIAEAHIEAVERLPMILAAVQIDFKSPILYGQEVEIGTRVDWVGRTSFSMSHHLTASPQARVVAEAATILVAYDYQTEAPMPMPDAWRSAFAGWEGRDLARPAQAVASQA